MSSSGVYTLFEQVHRYPFGGGDPCQLLTQWSGIYSRRMWMWENASNALAHQLRST